MNKYQKTIALFATIGWLIFILAAFRGFHFWYEGFIVFFYIALGTINYQQKTTVWLLKNKFRKFLKFYIFLIVFFFFVDYLLGQKIGHLWSYPYHTYLLSKEWLYLMYPLAGLAILELTYFIGGVFGEKLIFIKNPRNIFHKVVDKAETVWLLITLFVPVIFYSLRISFYNAGSFLAYASVVWIILYTIKLDYHLKHRLHWLAIFLLTAILSILTQEVPNVGVFEWVYHNSPFLNQIIFGIHLWVILAWYLFVILMLRFWIYVALRDQIKE